MIGGATWWQGEQKKEYEYFHQWQRGRLLVKNWSCHWWQWSKSRQPQDGSNKPRNEIPEKTRLWIGINHMEQKRHWNKDFGTTGWVDHGRETDSLESYKIEDQMMLWHVKSFVGYGVVMLVEDHIGLVKSKDFWCMFDGLTKNLWVRMSWWRDLLLIL